MDLELLVIIVDLVEGKKPNFIIVVATAAAVVLLLLVVAVVVVVAAVAADTFKPARQTRPQKNC